jgi:hypothetical protein
VARPSRPRPEPEDYGRGPLHRFFSRDHERLDAYLVRATEGPGPIDLEAFGAFRSGLLRHIGMEEKVLFVAAREARSGRPLDAAEQLRLEHGAIAALLVPTPTREVVAALRSLLGPHNRTEEEPGGVYDACDEALGRAAAERLVERLQSFPEPPLKPYADGVEVRRHIEANVARARRARPF